MLDLDSRVQVSCSGQRLCKGTQVLASFPISANSPPATLPCMVMLGAYRRSCIGLVPVPYSTPNREKASLAFDYLCVHCALCTSVLSVVGLDKLSQTQTATTRRPRAELAARFGGGTDFNPSKY
jgi:hypothetical protein